MQARLLHVLLPTVLIACNGAPAQTNGDITTQQQAQFTPGEALLIGIVRDVSPAVVGIRTSSGSGSGVIITPDGLIITNAHVVGRGGNVRVSLANGSEVDGRVLGIAQTVDIAVIDIQGDDLPHAVLGDSDALQVGQSAIAIGNPIGFERTVTTGVLSAMNRSLGFGYEELIQTDAAINPGNSGGPLLNSSGQVIGINTAAVREVPGQGPLAGLGFAIPINLARDIANQLATQGVVRRALLGIQHREVDPVIADQFGLPVNRGAIVLYVAPASPAQRAGLRQGDIITHIDDEELDDASDLRRILRQHDPGDVITVRGLRPQGQFTVRVELGEAVG
ncbi:MAG TPA: trypsin-like peptidase domain-containing protein [Longimicrobiales bacterium]|nr:trypsin-like peptidase domain-containing protein [Longimicrobiales bacterium]